MPERLRLPPSPGTEISMSDPSRFGSNPQSEAALLWLRTAASPPAIVAALHLPSLRDKHGRLRRRPGGYGAAALFAPDIAPGPCRAQPHGSARWRRGQADGRRFWRWLGQEWRAGRTYSH